VHVGDERRVARPQPRVVAGPREVHGKRGAPTACPENRDLTNNPSRAFTSS